MSLTGRSPPVHEHEACGITCSVRPHRDIHLLGPVRVMQIRCYVINLQERRQRLAAARRRLAEVGMHCTVFPARTGSGCVAADGIDLKGGERGCFLSHRDLLSQIGAEADGVHLVLEDDATFVGGFGARIQQVLCELPESWGYLQVGWLPTAREKATWHRVRQRVAALAPLRRMTRMAGRDVPLRQPSIVTDRPAWGTHCYAVRPWFARKMAGCLSGPPFAPVDYYFRFLWEWDPRGMFRTRYPLAGQDWTMGSDVDPARFSAATTQVDDAGRLVKPDKAVGMTRHERARGDAYGEE